MPPSRLAITRPHAIINRRSPMSLLQAHLSRPSKVLLVAAAIPALAPAQAPDTVARLGTVRVTVSRDAARPVLELPFAVSRLELDSARAGTRRASLTEALLFAPGVTV